MDTIDTADAMDGIALSHGTPAPLKKCKSGLINGCETGLVLAWVVSLNYVALDNSSTDGAPVTVENR